MKATIEKQIWDFCQLISDEHNGIVEGIHVDGDFNSFDSKQEFTVYTSTGGCVKVWREESWKDDDADKPTGDEGGYYYDMIEPYCQDGFVEIGRDKLINILKQNLNPMKAKNNDYDYSASERVMISEMRDMLIQLTDKVNTDSIKRADLITVIGATQKRIGHFIDKLNNPEK